MATANGVQYTLHGSLVFDNGLPAAGLAVRSYNIGFAGQDTRLGEVNSDGQGSYSFSFQLPTGQSPNLQVRDEDVRTIEKLLGIPERSVGAPLWMSGDTRHCPKCDRETNWLDIVSSALTKTHQRALLVEVILGDRKYVNVEVPHAIADLFCYNCKNPIVDLRSLKCHNWAYAREDILQIIGEEASARAE
jgi:hypothetical protein